MTSTPPPRAVQFTDRTTELALHNSITPLPPGITPDAVVVFPGLGENDRYTYAIKLREQLGAKYLIVAGTHVNDHGHFEPDETTLKHFGLVNGENLLTQPDALNTPDQADWLGRVAAEHDINTTVLTASRYHMVRAYLTAIRSMDLAGRRFVMMTMPVPRPLSSWVPQLELDQLYSMPGEYDRIPRYQQDGENGDPHRVATLAEALAYDQWLYAQEPLRSLF
jgi:hypothetical protein